MRAIQGQRDQWNHKPDMLGHRTDSTDGWGLHTAAGTKREMDENGKIVRRGLPADIVSPSELGRSTFMPRPPDPIDRDALPTDSVADVFDALRSDRDTEYGQEQTPRPYSEVGTSDRWRPLDDSRLEKVVVPAGDKLEQVLYREFMDWWDGLDPTTRPDPDSVSSNWKAFPDEPVTHWLNVEKFLEERYPDAATNSTYGVEHAEPLLHSLAVTPDEMDAKGYSPRGNIITQVMLNLHNQRQGREWSSRADRRRYYELMLRHIGPDARRRSARLVRLVQSWRRADDDRAVAQARAALSSALRIPRR